MEIKLNDDGELVITLNDAAFIVRALHLLTGDFMGVYFGQARIDFDNKTVRIHLFEKDKR